MIKHETIDGFYLIPGFNHHYINIHTAKIMNGRTGTVLKTSTQNSGYEFVSMNEFGVRSAKTVHRLMAITFIPNPLNKPQVNHIDGVKLNNKLENLEWVTLSENSRHAESLGLTKNKNEKARIRMRELGLRYGKENSKRLVELNQENAKPVLQYSIDGEFIKEWPSIKSARRAYNAPNINKVIRGEHKQCKGYKWQLK